MARLPCDCIGVRAEVHLTGDKSRSQAVAGVILGIEANLFDPILDHPAQRADR